MTVIPITGCSDDRVDPRDRGLAYGDGLFETMRWHDGRIPLLDRHLQRLRLGAQRLALALPELGDIAGIVGPTLDRVSDAVVKLVVTRGVGRRGYASPDTPQPTAFLLVDSFAPRRPMDPRGLTLHWCETRLAIQPLLAGIKHINRLEQVLARAEWAGSVIDEGLMCDPSDHVVCAVSNNVFAVLDGCLVTPAIDHAGVAGVARAVLMDALDVIVRQVSRAEFASATEVFLCNAVHGAWPVIRLGGRALDPGPMARAAAAALATAGLPPDIDR
jgi:4-amino-4-deoxychorismate lyase